MAVYHYRATTMDGQILEGEMEGRDQAAVIAKIQEAGHIPIRAEPVRKGLALFRRHAGALAERRLSRSQMESFTQELSALLQAGMPLDRSLQIMLEVNEEEAVSALIGEIQESIRAGTSLSEALSERSGTFSPFYVNMVRAAEAGGRLDVGLQRLVEHLEKARQLREKVLAAMVYPSILVSVAGLSMLLILTYVIPKVTEVFDDVGATLPLATRVVIGAAELFRGYGWLLLLAIVAGVMLFRRTLANPEGRHRWHERVLRTPLVGDLIRKLETARFSRSLGALLANGLPLLNALTIARDTVSNQVLANAVSEAAETVKTGRGLTDRLTAQGLFPKLALQMMKVGEETGRLEEMLLRIADTYDRETANAIQRFLAFLEPVLIVGLGAMIGGIIMSVLVAIVSINELPV